MNDRERAAYAFGAGVGLLAGASAVALVLALGVAVTWATPATLAVFGVVYAALAILKVRRS